MNYHIVSILRSAGNYIRSIVKMLHDLARRASNRTTRIKAALPVVAPTKDIQRRRQWRYYSAAFPGEDGNHGPLKGVRVLDLTRVLAVRKTELNASSQTASLTVWYAGAVLYPDSRRLWCRCHQSRSCGQRCMFFLALFLSFSFLFFSF